MEASVFKWVKLKQHATNDSLHEHTTIELDDVVYGHGIPRSHLKAYIHKEVEEMEACMGLPFTLLLVVSYAFVALWHFSAAAVRAVEESLDFDIVENANFAFTGPYIGHKNLHDVNSIVDFWSWARNGIVPLIFIQEKPFAESFDETDPRYIAAAGPIDRGYWLHYNRIVGGIRMRQERSGDGAEAVCNTAKGPLVFFDFDCVGGLGYELNPDLRTAYKTSNPQREVWLYAHEDVSVLMQRLWDMERDRWLDRQTRKVELAIPLYNAELGVHSLVAVDLFFSRGGHIWKKVIPFSVEADWHPTWFHWAGDSTWLLCILYILLTEVYQILGVVRRNGFFGIWTEYISIWNAFDWVSILCATSLIVMFSIAVSLTGATNTSLRLVQEREEAEGLESQAFLEAVTRHADTLETCVHYIFTFRIFVVGYPLIIVLRLFKAYAAQPRLAVVTKTLENAAQDLLHFLLVFSSVFLAFAISGVVLFGSEVTGFGTPVRALFACFRMLLGDLMWDEISKVGRVLAIIWLGAFMIVVVLLLLNMLLAIIMDHYVEVKKGAGEAEPLWEETLESFTRWRAVRRGEAQPMSLVLEALTIEDAEREEEKRIARIHTGQGEEEEEEEEEEEDDQDIENQDEKVVQEESEVIFPDDLQHTFREKMGADLPELQAHELFRGAIKHYHVMNKGDVNMEEVMALTRRVEHRSKKILKISKDYDKQKCVKHELKTVHRLASQVEEFTDELREEQKLHMSTVEDLRQAKAELLDQLGHLQATGVNRANPAVINSPHVAEYRKWPPPKPYEWRLSKPLVSDEDPEELAQDKKEAADERAAEKKAQEAQAQSSRPGVRMAEDGKPADDDLPPEDDDEDAFG